MLLTQTAEYVLRAMCCLALHPGKSLNSRDLGRLTAIPNAYMSKVMRRLVVAGLVRSQRGHGGGFSLTRPPPDITFLEIFDAVDYGADPNRCAFGMGDCDSSKPCPLHHSWSVFSGQFRTWAGSTSLQEVVDHPGESSLFVQEPR